MVYFNYYENSKLLKEFLILNLRLRYLNYFFILFFIFVLFIHFQKCPLTYYLTYAFGIIMILVYVKYISDYQNIDGKVNIILNPIEDDELNQKVRSVYLPFFNYLKSKNRPIIKYILNIYYILFPFLILFATFYMFYVSVKIDFPDVSFFTYLKVKTIKIDLQKKNVGYFDLTGNMKNLWIGTIREKIADNISDEAIKNIKKPDCPTN